MDFSNPRLSLVKFIVQGKRPLSICEDDSFRDFCEQFAIHYKDSGEFPHCSFDTLRNSIVETGQTCIEHLKKIIMEQSVAIATALWTSTAKQTYIGATAHFIDGKWSLHSIELCCRLMTGTHSAVDLKREIEALFEEFSAKKVSCLITDNEATNISLGNTLTVPWIGCFAHLVNLVVKVIEEIPTIKLLLSNINSLVEHFNKSNQHLEQLVTLQLWKVTQKRLQHDVKTRWSSFLMKIKRICELKMK